MNKHLVSKLREEAIAVLNEEPGNCVTYANHKSFVWSNAVIFETLRLHPSVPKVTFWQIMSNWIPAHLGQVEMMNC
jgi:cytochrome P450